MSNERYLQVKPYKNMELYSAAVNGEPVNMERALATYADPRNWTTIYDKQGAHWTWKGPIIVGYELAQFAMRDAAKKNGVK